MSLFWLLHISFGNHAISQTAAVREDEVMSGQEYSIPVESGMEPTEERARAVAGDSPLVDPTGQVVASEYMIELILLKGYIHSP